jgi:uncharacterized membrane protein YfcA
VDWLDFGAATLAVMLGSIIQAVSGVGGGFLIVPLLAWIDLSLVPGPMIFASLSLSGIMAFRERANIDAAHMPAIFGGLLPGCLVGAYVISIVPADNLGFLFGTVILIAIGITVSGLRVPLNNATAFVSAAASGAMGASTGIGAPMLALLYQNETGSRVRSTLALLYTIASVIIILVLLGFDRFGWSEVRSGILLVPGFLLGYFASGRLTRTFDKHSSRIAVLVVSGVAALALMARSLF